MPQSGKRPGEGDIVAMTGTVPLAGGCLAPDRGALAALAMYAGQGVDAIYDISSAGELVVVLFAQR
jgi:hypothetical protein